MNESFFVATRKEIAGELSVKKLHINIWNIFGWNMLAEVGLLMKFPSKYITEKLSATLELNTPYASKEKQPHCLHDSLAEEKMIQLLFNEQVVQKTNVPLGDNSAAPVFRLTNKLSFVLLRPSYSSFQQNRELSLRYDFADAEASNWSCLLESEHFLCYTRFRYRIDKAASRCIHYDRHFFYKSAYIDLRVNEARTGTSFYERLVPIEMVQFFLITPLKKSTRDFGGQRNSVRLLETEKWRPYLRKLVWVRRPMLVHYWKKDVPSGSSEKLSYNSLAVITAERKEIRYLLILVAVLVLGTIILPLQEEIVTLVSESWYALKAGWKWILGGVVAISALIMGNMIWDGIKITAGYFAKKLSRAKPELNQ
jgi:hypothetical protein